MAGLLAWAADVVGAQTNGAEGEDLDLEDERVIASILTPDQLRYAQELERRSTNLRRSIQDLRLRIPPPSVAQRLPDLHAHSLASNAALALQLNAHSTTREQAQLREVTLQEENIGYERTISNCQKKIQEKLQEATLLQNKLKELDITEEHLRRELENAQSTLAASQSDELVVPKIMDKDISEGEHPTHGKPEELEKKKRELSSMEALVKDLEDNWTLVQQDSLKQPSAAQREKTLEKQLHSLIEQLTAKQAQAEGLASEIQAKQQELDVLNALRRNLENGNQESNTNTRSRYGRGVTRMAYSTDYAFEGRVGMENQQKLMFMRSAFVLYVLVLHILVFIKISF